MYKSLCMPKLVISSSIALLLGACGGSNNGYIYYTMGDEVVRYNVSTKESAKHIKTHFPKNTGVTVSEDASIFAVSAWVPEENQEIVDFYDLSSELIYHIESEYDDGDTYGQPYRFTSDNSHFLIRSSNSAASSDHLSIRGFDGDIVKLPIPAALGEYTYYEKYSGWDFVNDHEVIFSAWTDSAAGVFRLALNDDFSDKGEPEQIMDNAPGLTVVNPAGTKVAYLGSNNAVFIMNIDGTEKRKIAEGRIEYDDGTFDLASAIDWSPDGNSLVVATLGARTEVYNEGDCSIIAVIPANPAEVVDVFDPQYWIVDQPDDTADYTCASGLRGVSWRSK